MAKEYTSERQIWDALYGPNSSLEEIRAIETQFRKLFPDGHTESIRWLVEGWTQKEEIRAAAHKRFPQCLDDMHPRAFELLAKYGRDYTPVRWLAPPDESVEEPRWRECSQNSWNFSHWCLPQLVYVEGVTMGALQPPMLHAWNAKDLGDRNAVDFSEYSTSHWNRYFGVALTRAEFSKLGEYVVGKRGWNVMPFKKEHFPKAESFLEDLLAQRATGTKTAA